VKNYEKNIPLEYGYEAYYSIHAVLGDQYQVDMQNWSYFRVQALMLTQQSVNHPDEAGYLTGKAMFTNVINGDVYKDDGMKVFPNVGKRTFVFLPTNTVLYITDDMDGDVRHYPINLNTYSNTDSIRLLDGFYSIPGRIYLRNDTVSDRRVNCTLRIEYRGSREYKPNDNKSKELDPGTLAKQICIKKIVPRPSLLEKAINIAKAA
jgi:hypothetical protein